MDNKNPIRVFTGGRASRAEVYGLFIAAVVLIGGGVSGAIALNNADQPVQGTVSESSPTGTSSPSASAATDTSAEVSETTQTETTTPDSDQASSGSTTNSTAPQSGSTSATTVACPYTQAEQTYYNNIRATKQEVVDQAQAYVDNVHSWIASNTAHLEELLAAPYRPIEVFQRNPDGSPYVWRVDSNEEIAFERQRITDNQSELVRAEDALRRAIADRDQIPGC